MPEDAAEAKSQKDLERELELLHRLLGNFSTLQSQFDNVHKAGSVDEAFRVLGKIFVDGLEVSAVRCLSAEPDDRGKYPVKFTLSGENVSLKDFEDDEGLVEWASGNNSVMLVPVEDEGLLNQGLKSMVIMPIQGNKDHGTLLMWVSFSEKAASKFITDLLRNTAREFASVVDNMDLLEQVQSVHSLMDNIIESIPQGIFAIDQNDNIVACNRDIEVLFNVTRGEILQKRYQEAFQKEVVDFLSELVISTLNGEESLDHELKLKPMGEGSNEITVGVSTSLLYSREGTPQGLVFICRDLSLSLEVQRLREIDVMKSEFIHTVSHELKTPLTAIMGGCELLNTLSDDLPEECQQMVGIIDEGGKRLHSLITDLLDLSRLESGKLSVDQQVIDLTTVIRDTVELLKNRNAAIEWDITDVADSCKTLADPLKMKQVMENLIGNAVKYSPEGGQVKVILAGDDSKITFKVSDRGIGVPEDQLPFLWDKFYRVDSSTTAKIEGTGLGLPIVKHIIEMHGGEVTATSVIGEGSTFGFWIPSRMT